MQRNAARFGLALVSVVALLIGVLSLIDFWPNWVWITLGVAGLVGIVAQFAWELRGGAEQPVTKVKQTQKAGKGSQNVQSGRDTKDVRFGADGDPKDKK